MAAEADAEILAESPLFALLGEAERSTLADLLEVVHYRQGESIYETGERGDSLLILRKGRVRVILEDGRGQRIVLGEGGPGEIFGEISLFDGGPRTAGIVALTDVEALSLDRDDLLELITRRPTAALSLLTVMGGRLRANSEILRSRGSRNVDEAERERPGLSRWAADSACRVVGSWGFLAVATAGLVALATAPRWSADAGAADRWLVPALIGLVFLQVSVLMIAWNRQAARGRLKDDLDYRRDLKTELAMAELEAAIGRVGEQVRGLVAGSEADGALGRSSRPPLA